MNLFLFLLLPLSLCLFIKKNGVNYLIPVFIGLISAILVCSTNSFFLTTTHIVQYRFQNNFFAFLLKQIIIPVFVMYGLFFGFSKDSYEYKIKSFFPLLCAFYSIYMPFFIIKGHSVNYSFYELFEKPVLFLVMISTTSVLIKKIFEFSKNNILFCLLYIACTLVYLILPAVIQTQYILSINKSLRIILYIIYTLPSLTAYILSNFFDIKLNFFPIEN